MSRNGSIDSAVLPSHTPYIACPPSPHPTHSASILHAIKRAAAPTPHRYAAPKSPPHIVLNSIGINSSSLFVSTFF